MCGIMGFIRTAKPSANRVKVLEELMIGIQSRGNHATGVSVVSRTDRMWAKAPYPARMFVRSEWWEKAVRMNPELMIGHARFATHGDASRNVNNHPHVSADLRWMLVHNGVIHEDAKSLGVALEGECDSEIILRLIERDGVEKTVDLMQGFSTSWYACLAIDTVKGVMWAWRNERSPLVIANMSDTIGGVVLASTEGILRDAVRVAGVKVPEVFEIAAGYRYQFPMGMGPKGIEKLELRPAPVEIPQREFSWTRYARPDSRPLVTPVIHRTPWLDAQAERERDARVRRMERELGATKETEDRWWLRGPHEDSVDTEEWRKYWLKSQSEYQS
jgi:hypothetical protein